MGNTVIYEPTGRAREYAALADTDCDYVVKADLRQYLPAGVPAERRRAEHESN